MFRSDAIHNEQEIARKKAEEIADDIERQKNIGVLARWADYPYPHGPSREQIAHKLKEIKAKKQKK